MKRDERERLEGTPEFQEIKKYYDDYHGTIQHNISVHVYWMRIGKEPIGKVQYVGNTFILPVPYPVPKERQWEQGPDGIYHPPYCHYRESGYKANMFRECRCGKKRKKPIFEKMKQVRDKKLESIGEHEEEVSL